MARTHRSRRRTLAAAGLLVPGLAFAIVSAYIALGYGSSSSNDTGVAVASFPLAVVCIVVGAALLRGALWSRWPSVVIGAALATICAAGALAGGTALGGDGSDVSGALLVGFGGIVLALICALPVILLPGERGAQAFPPT